MAANEPPFLYSRRWNVWPFGATKIIHFIRKLIISIKIRLIDLLVPLAEILFCSLSGLFESTCHR